MIDLRAGQTFRCGPTITTAYPSLDWETYSEAGYVWIPDAPTMGELFDANAKPRGKWASPAGLSNQNRGLGAVGARNYVQHPTFEVLSLAYDLLDGKGPRRYVPPFGYSRARCLAGDRPPTDDPAYPWDLLAHVLGGGLLEAWNSAFEWQVWEFYCVPCWGWPSLRLDQMRCAMAKSRAAGYPGALDDAAAVLKTTPKDKRGKDLVRKLTVPKNPTKGNPDLRWTPFTATDDFRAFYEYNQTDVAAEIDAGLRIPDLSPHELRVWLMDQAINMRGMQVDRVAIENCICIIEQAYAKYNAELATITNGAVQGASEVAKTLVWLKTRGIHLFELDEESVTDTLKRLGDADPAAKRVLQLRQLLAFGSVKKLYAFRAQSTPQGRLYDQFVFCGAHTKLWNGRGVQPANLYRGQFSKPEQVEKALAAIATRNLDLVEYEYGDALDCVAGCLRSMIVAAPGHRLISADFSAIQAVVTSALAGEEWRLEVFRTHGKIYEAMASRLTGNDLQFYIDYKKQHGKHHDHRQNPGKLAVLSGDFGAWIAGWKRFGADKLLGSDDNIKAAILKTRNAQPMITELWGGQTRDRFTYNERPQLYGLEGAAISAVLSPGEAFGYRGMVYQVFDDTLYCSLPSSASTGSYMTYHHPRLVRAQPRGNFVPPPWELSLCYYGWNSNQTKGAGGWVPMDLYGGVFTQNNVAHESTQIQRAAMLALEDRGYPITFHNHDENAAEVINGYGSVDEYLAIMRDASRPTWARTPEGEPWPIKVPDAWEAVRYGKWEE